MVGDDFVTDEMLAFFPEAKQEPYQRQRGGKLAVMQQHARENFDVRVACGAQDIREQRANADIALRQWAFERAQQIIGTTAMTEDVIESADAILAWVTKRNTNG